MRLRTDTALPLRSRGPRRRPARPLLVLLAAAACVLACSGDERRGSAGAAAGAEIETGDLPALRERGGLRVLVELGESHLPREGSVQAAERQLAETLADDLGLELEWVAVERFDQLFDWLLQGRGDLAMANLTATAERRERLAFSVPLITTREVVVTRADDESLQRPADLEGRTLAVRRNTAFWPTAQSLAREHPGLRVQEVDESMGLDAILDAVATGEIDCTLVDGNWMRAAEAWHPDLRTAFELGQERLIAWAMRPDAIQLRRAVDGFLARTARLRDESGTHTGDLDTIRERGVLRVLTRNNATTYFVWRGELQGFDYELVRRFARSQGLRLQMIVVPTREDLAPWLRSGRGDLVAAGLTASPERAERLGVRFTRPVFRAAEILVSRSGDPIDGPEDLAGRRVHVRPGSSYRESLERLRAEQEIDFEIVFVDETRETEEILRRLASGEIELTVADEHILGVEQALGDGLRAAFALGEPRPHGWAVRPGSPRLLAALDAFLEEEYRGLFYNVTRNKYFLEPDQIRRRAEARPSLTGRLSPYDELVRRYSRQYGFDWRLVVAQMRQESRFDPEARSRAGARGLLQVMPRTAAEMGFDDLEDPETGLHAGIRYAAWLRDRFPESLPAEQRIWFALAAYNVGLGHVRDARRLARERGLDPDRWFGHVEQAMLLKEEPSVYRQTRFGYARGREPVQYVRSIRDRWEAYLQAQRG